MLTSTRIINSVHQIEDRGSVVQVDSRESSPFAVSRKFDFPPRLLSTSLQECLAQSIGDNLGQRSVRFQGGLLCLKNQIVRQIDGCSHMLKHTTMQAR